MSTRKKNRKQTYKPVDFQEYSVGGELNVIIPPEATKKTLPEVVATINKELNLVAIGLSKNCSMAIQFDKLKTPFCRVLAVLASQEVVTANQATDLIRLAFQDFGNKFAQFVKDELRLLF